jgi:RNA polymerase sigma-70 factor (ECF subfamily)
MTAPPSSGQERRTAGANSAHELHQQLIEGAVAGDRTALERLLILEFGAVQRHITQQLPDWLRGAVSVEDLLQDTFAQAFRDIGQFDFRSERSLRSWLCTIADHRLQDLIRRLRRKKRGGGRVPTRLRVEADRSSLVDLATLLSDRGDSPSQAAARGEVVQAVHVGLASLPEDQREAVRRRYLERQDYLAAAKAMDRSPEAVRSLVYRAKHSLRDFMGRSSRWFFK